MNLASALVWLFYAEVFWAFPGANLQRFTSIPYTLNILGIKMRRKTSHNNDLGQKKHNMLLLLLTENVLLLTANVGVHIMYTYICCE